MAHRPAVAGPPSSSKRVIGYTRVSTDEQTISPAEQRGELVEWADSRSVELVDVESDVGTGKLRDIVAELDEAGLAHTTVDLTARPGLLRAIRRIRSGEADMLVASKRDRLFRSLDGMCLLERLLGPGKLITVQLDTSTMGGPGKILAAVMDATAEWEGNEISDRTRANLQKHADDGHRAGGVPFGLADPQAHLRPADRDPNRKLEPVETEARTIKAITKLASEGLGPRAICSELTRRGHKPRGDAWHPNTIRRVLRRLKNKADKP